METKESLEQKALADFNALKGTIIKVYHVDCYHNEHSVEVTFIEPVLFVVDAKQDLSNVIRWMDGQFLDPVYDLTPLSQNDPALVGLNSFWVYGESYDLKDPNHRSPSSRDWEATGRVPPPSIPPDFIDYTIVGRYQD